jgi:ADP-ribose pyrophosphatase YjhB (NUDIX family)
VRKLSYYGGMNDFLDENGRALSDYTRPSLTVDTAVLTVMPHSNELAVALVRTADGRPCLPGTFIHENESLVQAARRALREKVGLRDINPLQLHVFDEPGRDPRGWVISVAHIAVVRFDEVEDVSFTPAAFADGLAYDHDAMLAKAIEKLRADYSEIPDPWNLLETFTLKELREVHEAIDPNTPLRDSFRRLMQPMVVDTGEMSSGSVGKPSRIWRKETEAERLQRIYAKYERPVSPSSSRSLSSKSSDSFDSMMYSSAPDDFFSSSSSSSERQDRNYVLEIEWLSGDTTKHESLSPTQAGLRLREFEQEVKSAWVSLPDAQKPRRAIILDPWGNIEKEVFFSET